MTIPPTVALSFPGGTEWLLILVVVLIFFGHKIPGVARSLGSGISEFKAGLREGERKERDPQLPPPTHGPGTGGNGKGP